MRISKASVCCNECQLSKKVMWIEADIEEGRIIEEKFTIAIPVCGECLEKAAALLKGESSGD